MSHDHKFVILKKKNEISKIHFKGAITGDSSFVPFAYGFAVMFGIYSSMSISGGHLNPAVSFTMATFGRLGSSGKENWTKFVIYAIAQFVGKYFK